MTAPNPSLLDAGQTLQGAFDETAGELRTKIDANNSSIEAFQLDPEALQVTSHSPSYQLRVDTVSSTILYLGESDPGSLESASVWRIQKIDLTTGVSINFANGEKEFDKVWDNRTGYTY